jgi:hypothetical protein
MLTRSKQPDSAIHVHERWQYTASRHVGRASSLLLILLLAAAPAWAGMKAAVWADSVVHLDTLDSMAGLWSAAKPEHHKVGTKPTVAVGCASDRPTFGAELGQLRQALGDDIMGEARECPHVDRVTGDRVQVTSTGLAAYRESEGRATFTDGYRHWALDVHGLMYWEGDSSEPAS